MRLIATTVLIILMTGILAASNIFSECSALPSTDQVTITWMTQNENSVSQFIILRSNDDKNYVELERVNSRGPGSRYEFVDENVMFKDTSVLFYKIRAVDSGGNVIEEQSMPPVHPNISGMFRTWGAIKAMFR